MAIQAQMYSDYSMELNNLCFVSQQQRLQQEQQLMQRVPPFHQQSVAFSQTFSAHIDSQKSEIDLYIHLQNERLRMELQEQRKQQISVLMKKYESKIQIIINQKDEEIEKAAKRTSELREILKRMEIESQTWQRVARENEAMAASLNSTIERLRETAAANNAADDAESCCCLGEEEIEIGKNLEQKPMKMVCRSCNYMEARVIILPCGHLCSCRECEAFLDWCPVCKTVKKAGIEALI